MKYTKEKIRRLECLFFQPILFLPKLIHLATSRRITLFNATLECRLLENKMVAGEMKRMKKKEVTQRL